MSYFGFPGLLGVGRYLRMDQTVARILESLERMLLAKAISPAKYLEATLAHHRAAVEKEASVKIEMQEDPVKSEQEAPVKITQEAPV